MIRLVFFALAFGILFALIKYIISSVRPKKCNNCDGEGYWKATRGERNFCKVCNGTGLKVPPKKK